MSAWISQQMANNLMKWWKTKFLNGYRQFSGKGCYCFNVIKARVFDFERF